MINEAGKPDNKQSVNKETACDTQQWLGGCWRLFEYVDHIAVLYSFIIFFFLGGGLDKIA